MRPKSVAIVGASERADWPKKIFLQLKDCGYAGAVYPVNPRLATIWDAPCYPDLSSLPEPPEHAVVIVPAPAVQDVLEKGVAAGLKSATVYAGNIGEGLDPTIVARGAALRDLVARSGLVVNGPNCMGGNAVRERFFGYPNPDLLRIEAGAVACVSQSGGTLQFLCQSAAARGVKFSYMFSSGNEIDLDLADFIDFFVDDDATKVIALFIEGVRRPDVFMRAAARALKAGKPIVAIKTGKSRKSREAAQSHTGAVAGDYEVFRAMCERYGIVVCDELDDLVETLLAFQPGRFPKGNRVGFVTTSGGTVDLLYDHIETFGGIVAPDFCDETQRRIRHLVPAELALKNPLDAGIPSTDANAVEMCLAVAADPAVDMLAWAGVLPGGKRKTDAGVIGAIVGATDKPVIAFGRMNYMVAPEALAFQDAVGFPFLQGLPATVRALRALAFYGARAGRAPPTPMPVATEAGEALEAELKRRGVVEPRGGFAASPQAAAALAAEIGFPVALKIVSPQVSHKTEVGGVRLGLRDAQEVARAADALAASLRAQAPEAQVTGFLVQEMVSGVEMIVGARVDPLYGPMLVVGAGGVLAELVKDVACRLLPVGEADIESMLSELRAAQLLSGFRGGPPADVDALKAAIAGVADTFLARRDRLSDLEVNPLIVGPVGRGARAVDIRAIARA